MSLNYAYHTSFPTGERLCVQGCFLGGDGSGGRYSRDPRVRTCGFGLAVVSASVDYESAKLLGHVIGSTPGKQTVPRSEAVVLLHALKYTRGNATYVCDNYSVFQNFQKGALYSPVANGLLWQAINSAREQRLAQGFGFLEVVWIKSHLTLESAVNAGYPWQWWLANWYADRLADAAAEKVEVHSDVFLKLTASTTLAKTALAHAVEVAVVLAPHAKKKQLGTKADLPSLPSEGKEEKVRRLARSAGHSLTKSLRCAKCKLKILFTKPCHTSKQYLHVDLLAWQYDMTLVLIRLSLLTFNMKQVLIVKRKT